MAERKTTTAKRAAAEQEHEHEAQQMQEHENGNEQGHEQAGRSVPVLVPEMHVRHIPVTVPSVHVPMPGMVRDRLPDVTTNRALWWGGLAALAVTEVISWPVAGVVAAGSYVAERRAKAAVAHRSEHTEDGGAHGSG